MYWQTTQQILRIPDFQRESVYVKADASGNVKKTTVSEWLKNPEKGTISDTSELKDD